MNSQVETTSQEVQSVGLTELELLEAAFNHELRCEASHHDFNPVCSGDVVVLFKNCVHPSGIPVCSNSHKFCVWFFENQGGCVCGSLAEDCWKIIPI